MDMAIAGASEAAARWQDTQLRAQIERLEGSAGQSRDLEGLKNTPEDLRKAADKFKSLFVYMLLQEMRKTVPESGLMKRSGGEKMFQSMFDEEISGKISGRSGLGISETLYRQLEAAARAKHREPIGPSA